MNACSTEQQVDIAIVGGGMVGASLLLALKDLPLSVALIEAVAPEAESQPSFDSRTLALSNATYRVFESLRLWSHWADDVEAVQKIHVSEKNNFGSAVVVAKELGLNQLGFILPAQSLGRVLWSNVVKTQHKVLNPASVVAMTMGQDRHTLEVKTEQGIDFINARLVIAADGVTSPIRRDAKLSALQHAYGHSALISSIKTSVQHPQTAFERFTSEGPIAILPRQQGVVVIWAMPPELADRRMYLNDHEYIAELQRQFGWRLGRLFDVGPRHRYELSLTVATEPSADRVILIGNAAQSLHPIAGQGFNLGLRDAMTLAELLWKQVHIQGVSFDPGDPLMLNEFVRRRQTDRSRVIRFTDTLVRGFGLNNRLVSHLRSKALSLFDRSLLAKRTLSAIASGGHDGATRLARGLTLTEWDLG